MSHSYYSYEYYYWEYSSRGTVVVHPGAYLFKLEYYGRATNINNMTPRVFVSSTSTIYQLLLVQRSVKIKLKTRCSYSSVDW